MDYKVDRKLTEPSCSEGSNEICKSKLQCPPPKKAAILEPPLESFLPAEFMEKKCFWLLFSSLCWFLHEAHHPTV